jgi:murein DD-endopeptidase MepM/ murein hydrolase activator NlpD
VGVDDADRADLGALRSGGDRGLFQFRDAGTMLRRIMRPALLRPLAAAIALFGLLVVAPGTPARAQNYAEQLKDAQRRANEAARRYSAAATSLARTENEISALEAKLAHNQAELSDLQHTVRDFAVRQYVNGSSATDALLVEHDDLAEAARAQTMAEFVLLGSTQAIDQYRTARADMESTRSELEQKKAEQRAAAAELRKRQAEADAEVKRLAELERQRIERERREQARRAAAAAAARRRQVTTSGRAVGVIASGSWVCPVQGAVAFSNDWGQPRSGGRRHQGNDMFAPYGTPTVAPVSGRVVHRSVRLGGLSWYVYGDDGNTYFGTHLSGFAGPNGGHVAAGTVIGYVGTSGNARGSSPHLHFEIHPGGGAPVNPYPTVSRYC